MKKHPFLFLTVMILVLLVPAIACNVPAAGPTPDIADIVARTQTAVALEQSLTSTAVPESQPATVTAIQVEIAQPTQTASPSPTPTIPDCQDKAHFEGETIPDKSVFAPGEQFVKSWIMRNTGTCTWTPDYALVFDKGEQMGGTSPSPIGATVAPDQTVTLLLPQTAPQEAGAHEGYWMLQNLQGKKFGIGKNADTAFWVKINVSPDASSNSTLVAGPPTWEENFSNGTQYWYLGIDDKVNYDVQDGNLVITAQELVGDRWRVSELGILSDFYLEAKISTGKTCSGKDAYGFIFRAPSQSDNIIDTGYIYSISCDGTYRFYRMDSGNYVGVINWTSNPAIRAGANQTNLIGVKAAGSKLQFYANGTLLIEIEDNSYSAGLFGLMLRADSTPGFQIAIDRIAYWNLIR